MRAVENRLIASLPSVDRLRLLNISEPIRLVLSEVLAEPGQATSVYFPIEGFISLVQPVDGHLGLEVGMVGREGMVGANMCLTDTPSRLRALVQGAGTAHRIDAHTFRAEVAASAALRSVMHRYIRVLMEQFATSAVCLRFHLIGPRLARWLLMSHDRALTDTFQVTQEFLAYMLGVRRVGVTAAALVLKREGLIAYSRGALTVLNRPGLEIAACRCYADDLHSYGSAL